MIVIAIVALLAAIALPVVADYANRAKLAEAEPNRMALERAIVGLCNEDLERCVAASSGDWHPRAYEDTDKDPIAWNGALDGFGWSPDGRVRCVYSGFASDYGQPYTYVVGVACDVDDNDVAYLHAEYLNWSDPNGGKSAKFFCDDGATPIGSCF